MQIEAALLEYAAAQCGKKGSKMGIFFSFFLTVFIT
jgi:hypothetical protein